MREGANPHASGISAQQLADLERAASAGGPDGEQALRTLATLAARPSLAKPVLKELRRVLYRLRSRGIEVTPTQDAAAAVQPLVPAEASAVPSVRPVQAAASAIDADGAAQLEMVWEVRHDAWFVHAVVSDRRGLEAFEAVKVTRRRAVEEVERLVGSGLQTFEPEWGALMLAGALSVARHQRTGLPRSFVVARERLEPALSKAAADPYGWARQHWSPALRAAIEEDRQRLEVWARASATLLRTGEVHWDLSDALGPLLEEARRRLGTRLVLLPATRQSVVDRLAFRMSEVLHAPPSRERLAARLAYVALRLERAGHVHPARLAAAASTVLFDERAPIRAGVLEALVAEHLAPYLPEREPTQVDPAAPPAGRSRSGLLLPPGGL